MYSSETLNIVGYRDQAVPNTFLRQDNETSHVALLFPGFGYTAQMPVMYYSARMLAAHGADVLCVEYTYNKTSDFQALSDEEQSRWFYTDVSAACDAALSQRQYQQVSLVGKSFGTLAVGHLLTLGRHFPQVECMWLTPLLRNDVLIDQIKHANHHALFVIGTADQLFDAAKLAELQQATGGEVMVIEGADHGLEIAGDVIHSLDVLKKVMEKMQEFLEK